MSIESGGVIRRHCAEIERCNQRGGRMLSIVDLIAAGTFTPELAAYALAAIGRGASFMVGARPGGAGKTTVMGALLNFVPPGMELLPADSLEALADGRHETAVRRCYICHEIGDGPYYAYLWNEALRRYFELPDAGHMLATNLHADTYEEAYAQVCGENGVDQVLFRQMNLIFFLALERRGLGVRRRIASVWESDGKSDHRQLRDPADSVIVTAAALRSAGAAIDRLTASDARGIAEVRAGLLAAWPG